MINDSFICNSGVLYANLNKKEMLKNTSNFLPRILDPWGLSDSIKPMKIGALTSPSIRTISKYFPELNEYKTVYQLTGKLVEHLLDDVNREHDNLYLLTTKDNKPVILEMKDCFCFFNWSARNEVWTLPDFVIESESYNLFVPNSVKVYVN